MILAKVAIGKIISHYEGDETEINLTKDEKGLITAEMPAWAVELRESNLQAKVATEYLEWNYSTNQFEKKQFEPNWTESLAQTLRWTRMKRNKLLAESDSYFNTPDRPTDEATRTALIEYRQKLRDVTHNPIFSSVSAYESYCKSVGKFPSEEDFFPTYDDNVKRIIAGVIDYNPVLDNGEATLLYSEVFYPGELEV